MKKRPMPWQAYAREAQRPPDKPGSKRCPNCKRSYRKAKIENRHRTCPFCGKRV